MWESLASSVALDRLAAALDFHIALALPVARTDRSLAARIAISRKDPGVLTRLLDGPKWHHTRALQHAALREDEAKGEAAVVAAGMASSPIRNRLVLP